MVLTALAVLCLAPGLLQAQGESDSRDVYYARERTFLIPFQPDPGERRVVEVVLHVSTDEGKTYRRAATSHPNTRQFRFEAPGDGWYWFAVQTVDRDGKNHPPDLTVLPPGLKVCVDTQRPQVTLTQSKPTQGTVAIRWDIRDENLDLFSLRVDYRMEGSLNWVPLAVPQLARGEHSWDPRRVGKVEVRLQVSDKAGNTAEASAKAQTSAQGASSGAPPAAPGGHNIVHVNNRTFQLNYSVENVGASGVKHVEVWVTQDGRSWNRHTDDAKPSGPHSITVRSEGRYGFTLVPHSGVGLAPPSPKMGDEPQIWVQVDETAPTVQLRDVLVGRGTERGKLTVHWEASDPFLRTTPISITWAKTSEGPWNDLITNVENTGTYTCRCKDAGLPYEFYLQVEAIDEAGNKGTARTLRTVKVDLKVPRIGKVGVRPLSASGLSVTPGPR